MLGSERRVVNMRRTVVKLGIGLLLVAFVFGCGKNEPDQEKSAASRTKTSAPITGQPEDYFPTQVGLKWVYDITVGDTEPLCYNEISWPLGDKSVVYAYRGRFPPVVREGGRKRFSLIIRSKATAAKQGPLEYLQGVELEVVQDELGVFEDAKQVFWTISTGGRYMAHLVVTYDPMSTPVAPTGGPWGVWGQGDGYSMRLLFFGDRPGIQIGIGKEPTDDLLFDGPDANVEGYAGQVLLHFIRSVEGTKGEESQSELGRAFTEEMWYAKGKGLVHLEQKVGGKTSMTWTLSAVSKE